MKAVIRWYVEKQIKDFERAFDYDMSYARAILQVGVKPLQAFMRATELANFRAGLPSDVWHTARVVALREYDCGPCLQLVVTMAERDGVEPSVLSALLSGEYDALEPSLRLAARFTEVAIRRLPEAEELREQFRAAHGERGLVALSFVIAGSSLYPTVKYTLGFGKACSRTKVGEQWLSPRLAPAIS